MLDPILFYVGALTITLFFWIYGVVAFVRDVKTELAPWLLASPRGRSKEDRDERTDGTDPERRSY